MLRFYEDFSIDDAVGWLDFNGTHFSIVTWLHNDFGPHDAVQWSNEGFGPEEAALWRDSGVTSPIIAKRRRNAGLKP